MFNILAIGDPHFKADNGETTEELTDKIGKLIEERYLEIDAVVVLGDILHRHEKIDLHPFHRAMNFLEEIHKKLNRPGEQNRYLYIIIGNHDRSNNRVFMTDEHVFGPLKYWKNTFVVDTAMIHRPRSNVEILLMPYVPPGRFQEGYLNVISESRLNEEILCVFAHQEFHGAKMNTITSNEGDPWDSLKPLCISGHIHDYQELHSNMIYTGTPIQHGFADVGKKTVSLFKFLEPRKWVHERIDLSIRGKITVKFAIKDFDLSECPIDKYFVKAKLHGTKREIKTFCSGGNYKNSISKGVTFHFLEIATVEIDSKDEIIVKNTGINFSERVKALLNSFDNQLKETFSEIFKE